MDLSGSGGEANGLRGVPAISLLRSRSNPDPSQKSRKDVDDETIKKALSFLPALVLVIGTMLIPANALAVNQDADTAELDLVFQHAKNYLTILSTVGQSEISVRINYKKYQCWDTYSDL